MTSHLPARPPRCSSRLAAVLLLVVSQRAAGQIESALLSKISFNLTNPGGKSLAMGGAFTAIADDATAALANPGGLGLLSSIDAGIAFKRVDDTIGLVTARSTATGGLTTPYPPVKPVNSDIASSRSSADFAGVVLPVSRRVVAAVAYAENLRFRGDPGEDGYAYIELRDNRSGDTTRRDFLFEYREHGPVDVTNRLLAVSAAYRVTDRLRVGAGLTLNRMTFSLEGDAGGPHRIVNRTFISPTQVETLTVTMAARDFGDLTPGFLLGVHADVVPGKLTVGAAYRQSGRDSGTFVLGGDVPTALEDQVERRLTLGVPRDAALGAAYQPIPGLTVAGELQWIAYGEFIREELPVVSYRGLAGPLPGTPVKGLLASLSPPASVVVPRLGLEYSVTSGDLLLAFRLGYHREPARGVTADLVARDAGGTAYDVTDPPFSEAVRTVYDGGRPDDRFAGGLGATIGGRVSFDVSFDVGRQSRQLAASVFYFF